MAFIDATFSYNGITSDSMGVWLVKTSTDLMESQLFGDRSISYDTIPGRQTPYYYNETLSPFRVKLQLAPIDGLWTDELKERLSRWLNNGRFNEFYSTDDIDKRYFLTYIGSPSLNVTGNNEGYADIEFQNIDCYVRTPIYNQIFDLSAIGSTPTLIEIRNLGDECMKPVLEIKKVGAGSLSVVNLSDGGLDFKFNNLQNAETLWVDNGNRQILSDKNVLRYDDFSGNYMSMPYGVNRLSVTGACQLSFRYRHLYKVG